VHLERNWVCKEEDDHCEKLKDFFLSGIVVPENLLIGKIQFFLKLSNCYGSLNNTKIFFK
jgi:hypothetical protein